MEVLKDPKINKINTNATSDAETNEYYFISYLRKGGQF